MTVLSEGVIRVPATVDGIEGGEAAARAPRHVGRDEKGSVDAGRSRHVRQSPRSMTGKFGFEVRRMLGSGRLHVRRRGPGVAPADRPGRC